MIDTLVKKLIPFGSDTFIKDFNTVIKKRMENNEKLKQKTLTEYRKLYYQDETFRKTCRMFVSEFSEKYLNELFDPNNLAAVVIDSDGK